MPTRDDIDVMGPDTERPSSRDDYERAACVLTARDTTPPEADIDDGDERKV